MCLNLSVVGDVALAADDGLVGDLHEKGSHSNGVVVKGGDVVDHLHCVQQPHQRSLHLVWCLHRGGNINWPFPKSYLQVDSVAVLLSGSEVLCIIAGFHMVVGDLHVNLVPDLTKAVLSDQLKKTGNLKKFAVGRPQCDEGHLAGVGVDLLHQQGELGCPVFPVLYLNLDIKPTCH